MSDIHFRGIHPDTLCKCSGCAEVGKFSEFDSLIRDAGERIKPGEICPVGECTSCESLVYIHEIKPKPRYKSGINPVTIRTKYPGAGFDVVLMRMGLHIGGKDKSAVTFAFNPVGGVDAERFSYQPIYESEFLNAIGHLFPHGELSNVHIEADD